MAVVDNSAQIFNLHYPARCVHLDVRWKSCLDEFVNTNSVIQFDKAKLKAHAMDLQGRWEANSEGMTVSDYFKRYTDIAKVRAGISDRVNSAALSVIKLLSWIFINIVTLGLPSFICNMINDRKCIHYKNKLKEQNLFEVEQVRRAKLSYPAIAQKLTTQDRLTEEMEKLKQEKQTLEKQQSVINENDIYRKSIEEYEAQCAQIQSKIEAAYNPPAANSKSSLKKVSSKVTLPPLDRSGGDPLVRKYGEDFAEMEIEDERIDPVTFEVSTKKVMKKVKISERVNFIDALKTAFHIAIVKLEKMAEDGHVIFNKSPKLIDDIEEFQIEGTNERCFQRTYGENINAIYNLIALILLDNAKMGRDCHKNPVMHITEFVAITTPEAYVIPSADSTGTTLALDKEDALTAIKGDGKIFKFVDPIGAKWLIHKLGDKKKDILRTLLLDALIPDTDASLKQAKACLLEKTQDTKDLQLAMQLISDIADALSERYGATIDEMLGNYVDDDDNSVPLKKVKVNHVIKEEPLVDWNITKNPLLALITTHYKEAIERTKQILKTIWASGNTKKMLPKDINDKKINIELNKDATKALIQIREYFHVLHLAVNDSKCLFSALALQIFQGARDKEDINPQVIKDLMATYLHNNKEAWREKIKAGTRYYDSESKRFSKPLSLEQYSQWLRYGDYVSYTNENGFFVEKNVQGLRLEEGQESPSRGNVGEFELKLFTEVFGIRVECFEVGRSFQKDGEIFRGVQSFGPNTKEKIYLLCSPQLSFYALHPKLRKQEVGDKIETRYAINQTEKYWEANSDIKLEDFYTDWKNFTLRP